MSTDTPRPFRSRGFIVAAAVVGLIAVIGVVALIAGLFNGDDDATPPTPTSTPAESTESVAEGAASVCGLPGYSDSGAIDSPPETEWELVGTVAAPTDPDGAGPGKLESNGFRSCYAHTPEGALFAAIGYVAVASDTRNTNRLYELLADGEVKDQLEATPAPAEAGADRLQVAGFKINSYNAEEAVIDIAWSVTSQGGALVSLPTVLKWQDGDWKVEIGTQGPAFAPSPLENLGGYIPWAGV
ncbi:hypothetical protein [Microbacterium telephonicum]|uniref:DUF8175 domain-containing protein n=1 Tax=Microbacterium telephonicum TaxID=1714841 RepID=A0A498BQQ7_9MICO|nr:hypothetical protein [Microbacterium telephonicum]RLK46463.1 hypothetical protein C7474_3001 [Microbacterium telephonicum]